MVIQESTIDMMDTVIDPMILVFYIIATAIFLISSYKKRDLKLFSITFLLMTGAILWCLLEVEIIEGIFVLSASVIAVIAAIILRMKTKKLEA